MKQWLTIISLSGLLTLMPQPVVASQLGQDQSIIVDGLKRHYSLHLPKNRENEKNLPLMIVLHGAKGSYKKSEGFTGMNDVADQGGFIVTYPNAYHKQWNDGRLPGDTPSYKVDDIHFLLTLMNQLEKKYQTDASRVYLVGFSSGGMMTQRFAMEQPGKVAAIAPIASSIPVPLMNKVTNKGVQPKLPMPVMMVNGTHDPAFPWEGGKTRFAGIRVGQVSPIETTLNYWLTVNGGQQGNVESALLPEKVHDGTQVEERIYHTHAGPEVVLYKITGGGHSWPGAKYPATYLPRFLYGKTSQQMNGSAAAWDFLKQYRRLSI